MPETTANPIQSPGGPAVPRSLPAAVSALLVLLIGIVWLTNLRDAYYYDFDEGVYLCSARQMLAGEPQYASVFSAQPPAFLEIITLSFRLLGDDLGVARGTIVIFALASLIAGAWIAWRFSGPWSAPIMILGMALPLAFFRQARSVQSEMPAMAFALWAMVFALHSRRHFLLPCLSGGFFALGVLCKLLVVPMVVPLIAWIMIPGLSTWGGWRRGLLFLGGLAAVCVAFVLPYDFEALYAQAVRFHFDMKSVDAYQRDPAKNAQYLAVALGVDFGLIALVLVGAVVMAFKSIGRLGWLLLWIVACGYFLLEHSPLLSHHPILLVPPLALAASACVQLAPPSASRLWLALVALPLFVCFPRSPDEYWPLSSWCTLMRDATVLEGVPPDRADEWKLIDSIRRWTEPDDLIISDDLMLIYRADRKAPPEMCDVSSARIKSRYLTDDQAIATANDASIIIFWTNRMKGLKAFEDWVKENRTLKMEVKSPKGDTRSVYAK